MKENAATPPSISFEEALRQLEEIVEAMESGQVPLETMVKQYESGMKLVRECQNQLQNAQMRISEFDKTASIE